MKFLPLGFLLLLSPLAHAQTPAPPIAEMQKWVATLDATWQEMYAKEVTAPFDAEMAKLAEQYLSALDASSQKASTAGDLDQTILWRAERERFALAKDVPAKDEATAPAALKQLHASWRAQAARLQKDRATHASAVLARYDAVLAQAQKQLTQAERIDEALLLKKQREQVAARWTGTAAPAPAVAPVESPKPPARPAVAEAPQVPKLDPREAVSQLLKAGARVKNWGDRSRNGIGSVSDLPEKFKIANVHFNPRKDGVAVGDADVALLANLLTVDAVGLHNLPVTDAALQVLLALPALQWLHLDNLEKVTGPGCAVLAQIPALQTLALTSLPAGEEAIKAAAMNKRLLHLSVGGMPVSEAALAAVGTHPALMALNFDKGATGITAAGIASLAKMQRLSTIFFEDFPVDDAMAAEIGKIDSLEFVDIRISKLTEAGAASLSRLRNVTRLTLLNPPVTSAALAAYGRMKSLKTFIVGKQILPENTDKLKAALKGVEIKL